MNFVANMASFSNDTYQTDSELAVSLLNDIMPYTNAKDKAVRFRSCQLSSKLLNRSVSRSTLDPAMEQARLGIAVKKKAHRPTEMPALSKEKEDSLTV
jgi:hypothetical protein